MLFVLFYESLVMEVCKIFSGFWNIGKLKFGCVDFEGNTKKKLISFLGFHLKPIDN